MATENYTIVDGSEPMLPTYNRGYLNIGQNSDIFNFLNKSKNKESDSFQSWNKEKPYLKKYSYWGFNNNEKITEYDNYNNIDFKQEVADKISNIGNAVGVGLVDLDLRKNLERKKYGFTIIPEHYFSTVDKDFNSELKHEWRTKFFQYGRMFRSLEQGALIQDFFSKNITLSNRALTPRQINDYF